MKPPKVKRKKQPHWSRSKEFLMVFGVGKHAKTAEQPKAVPDRRRILIADHKRDRAIGHRVFNDSTEAVAQKIGRSHTRMDRTKCPFCQKNILNDQVADHRERRHPNTL